jgi:2'-5' RNA ligase
MQVRELVVFASRLRRSGPLYQQLCHIPLRS